ncbi:lysylphosphatidylglycerol synthase domain-containing protein [Camelimonas abortus]|uniref:Lysylphosphatidylglycerol synthase domain-containing protein n=1 Tax=Camelimonas abortus TaxID=1017184 RepID=A0ABV7LGV7_9HYPH
MTGGSSPTPAVDADGAAPADAGERVAAAPRRRSPLSWLGVAASVTIFAASAWVLWRTAHAISLAEVMSALAQTPWSRLGVAAGLTALSYLFLTGYDCLALRQLRLKVPYRTTALGSFTSYAVSFTLGFPLLTSGTVRYWIYSGRGVKPGQIASLTVIAGITFWLGMGAVLAWCLMREAGEISLLTHTSIQLNQLAGLLTAATVAAYLAWVSAKNRYVAVKGWRLELPGLRLSLGQMALGAGDVCAAAGVLYVLLPAGHDVTFGSFLAIYVCACMLGVISHAPGGIGVFEAAMLVSLSALNGSRVLGALLLFRLIYYLLPFLLALALLGGYEVARRLQSGRAGARP